MLLISLEQMDHKTDKAQQYSLTFINMPLIGFIQYCLVDEPITTYNFQEKDKLSLL